MRYFRFAQGNLNQEAWLILHFYIIKCDCLLQLISDYFSLKLYEKTHTTIVTSECTGSSKLLEATTKACNPPEKVELIKAPNFLKFCNNN